MQTNDTKTFLGEERYSLHTFMSSSNLAFCKYDHIYSLLLVMFHNGSCYEYYGVDSNTYNELIASPSAGSYFNKVIKSFKCERVK